MSHGTLRLILGPALITAAMSVARLAGEVSGLITTRSGGAMTPLGITWFVFVFGAWFGYRLARAGSGPRVRYAPLWSALAVAALVAGVAWRFGPLVGEPPSLALFAELRVSVFVLVGLASVFAVASFVLWPALAWTLLLYALPARAVVVLITWIAKLQEWDTHYTKFGPPGIELDGVGETVLSASLAQFGFWVPFTVVGGTLAGSLFGRIREPDQGAPDR